MDFHFSEEQDAIRELPREILAAYLDGRGDNVLLPNGPR